MIDQDGTNIKTTKRSQKQRLGASEQKTRRNKNVVWNKLSRKRQARLKKTNRTVLARWPW